MSEDSNNNNNNINIDEILATALNDIENQNEHTQQSSSENDLEHCSICLDFQNDESIIMECCNKLIHSYCLSEWLKRKNNCPLCRTEQSSYYLNNWTDERRNYPELPSGNVLAEMMDNLISESASRVRLYEEMDRVINIGVTRPSRLRILDLDDEEEPLLPYRPPLFRRRAQSLYRNIFEFPGIPVRRINDDQLRGVGIGVTNAEIGGRRYADNLIPEVGIPIELDSDLDEDIDIGVTIRRNLQELDDIVTGVSSRMNQFNEVINNMNMYENNNIIGISYVNDNFNDIGITNIRIEADRENNISINLNNNDLNINFNVNNPNSLSELLGNISNEMTRLNENLNNIYQRDRN